jgi:hypothetical protein
LALERDFGGHEAFNICAPTTFMDVPTREMIRRYLPDVGDVRREGGGNWAGYDTSKASRLLGFEARHHVKI